MQVEGGPDHVRPGLHDTYPHPLRPSTILQADAIIHSVFSINDTFAAIVGVLALWQPSVLGVGYEQIEEILHGDATRHDVDQHFDSPNSKHITLDRRKTTQRPLG
mgnify:CR=1 FL=1